MLSTLSPSECLRDNLRSFQGLLEGGEGIDTALERIHAQKARYERASAVLAQRRQRVHDCETLIAELNAELCRLKGSFPELVVI